MADVFEDLMKAIEQVIDAKDDMWEEAYNCNYNYRAQIKQLRLDPAKEAMKIALARYIQAQVEQALHNSQSW